MSLYLWVNLLSISVPVIASFHPRIKFYRYWKFLFPAMLLAATPYIIWDVFFTKQGFWGFNPEYLSGIYLFSLPIEEWLFFITIPYACVFTHYTIQILGYNLELNRKSANRLNLIVLGLSFIIMVAFINLAYTAIAMLFVIIILFIAITVNRPLLTSYYITYIIILVPFFIVNGILTGTGIENEIVWYNDTQNLGIRLGTIPIEDLSYAFSLILLNIVLFEWLAAKWSVRLMES